MTKKKAPAKNTAGPDARKSKTATVAAAEVRPARARPSKLLDTRVVYCGDNLEQLTKLPSACVDLIYIDPPFNSNRKSRGQLQW